MRGKRSIGPYLAGPEEPYQKPPAAFDVVGEDESEGAFELVGDADGDDETDDDTEPVELFLVGVG